MNIKQISRSVSNFNPDDDFKIGGDALIHALDKLSGFEWERKIFKSPVSERELLVGSYNVRSKKCFKFTFIDGKIRISYDGKLTDEIIVGCNELSLELEAYLFCDIDLEFPRLKVMAAQKRLAKKSKEPQVEYQKESFGGNNMWLAIRSSLEEVKDFFNLDGEEKSWSEALEKMYACEGMFIYEFRGWTFIAGQNTDTLFNCQVKGEKAIEKCHVDRLIEWGRTFNDVQLFMHYDRSMYFNAFYRILNNKIIYGEYETESYKKEYGKLPKNIKDLPDNNANTVALEWSYDPDYLRSQKELENGKAWVVNLKD